MSDPAPILNGIPAPGNSFVLWDQKIVYMSVTKVACTSLRWMIADLAGEDLESFHSALGAQQTRLMTIHRNRAHWQKTPQLFQVPVAERTAISRDKGWFVFAVVRDPWSRLWSGWQSKFLVRHRYYVEHYADEPWFPAVPSSQGQVLKDWRRFVEARPWTTHPELSTDVHFLPQVFSVRPRGVNYTKVYDLSEIDQLFEDVKAHLERVGHPVEELYVPRANETPLPMIPAVLADGVAELIEECYAGDFEEYGDQWSLERVRTTGVAWSDDAIRHAAYHTVANERIGDLRKEARKFRREAAMATRRTDRLQAEVEALRARASRRPEAFARRVVGRARREIKDWSGRRGRTS